MTIKLNMLAIKKLMAENLMTNDKLGKLSGISAGTIGKIFKRGTCSVVAAGCIATALHVNVEEIWKEE